MSNGYAHPFCTCNNCTYEIDEASEQGFCDNCERAYQLGKEGK